MVYIASHYLRVHLVSSPSVPASSFLWASWSPVVWMFHNLPNPCWYASTLFPVFFGTTVLQWICFHIGLFTYKTHTSRRIPRHSIPGWKGVAFVILINTITGLSREVISFTPGCSRSLAISGMASLSSQTFQHDDTLWGILPSWWVKKRLPRCSFNYIPLDGWACISFCISKGICFSFSVNYPLMCFTHFFSVGFSFFVSNQRRKIMIPISSIKNF